MKTRIDMVEAIRLTRLGRLAEAMNVLGGRATGTSSSRDMEGGDGYIDMYEGKDGAWRSTNEGGFLKKDAPAAGTTKPRIDLEEIVSRFKMRNQSAKPAPPMVDMPIGARFDALYLEEGGTGRRYKLYIPANRAAGPAPLVVMLHGCTQSADDFAAGTRMNGLAEVHGFLVAYPEQSQSANMNRCWNWFNTSDQVRGHGEPEIIAGIVRQVIADHAVDAKRVYVAGLSAGGAMAAILGSEYPDIFAAVGIHSGLAAGAAHDMPSAFSAMSQGAKAKRNTTGRTPAPTIIFHGTADHTVNVRNADALAEQILQGRKCAKLQTLGRSESDVTFTRSAYTDIDSACPLELWSLEGLGHAWSGGHPSGSYTDSRGPDASAEMIRFFGM